MRLPLLGDRELGTLLGVGEREARFRRRELERLGWVEWVMPASPELQPRRRSFLRPGAWPRLAELLGLPPDDVARRLAVRRLDAFWGIAAMEAAVGVNALLAGLARGARTGGVRLHDARRIPSDRRGPRHPEAPGRRAPGGSAAAPPPWFPGGASGYACLRAGSRAAPFFVAWDRAAAPAPWRRHLLRRWEEVRRGPNAWGRSALPPVVVAAAGDAELDQWLGACRRLAYANGAGLELVLATVGEIAAHGPCAAIWRSPRRGGPAPLARLLGWRPLAALPAAARPPVWPRGRAALGPAGEGGPPLRRSPRLRLLGRTWPRTRALRERSALLALVTDSDEKRLLEYVGRNPLLDGGQLAALLDLPPAATERRIARLLERGAITAAWRQARGETGPVRRLMLAPAGLRWLADRDLVRFSHYAREGAATALARPGGSQPTRRTRSLRHLEHTLGINRALVRFAVDARACGARLRAWYPEAASERHFARGGRRAIICPDGSGVLVRGAETCSFLLEYDRGTASVGSYREKLAGYREYFLGERWRDDFPSRPLLLFAFGGYRIEGKAIRAQERWEPGLELLLASEWEYEWGRSGGILGPVWSRPSSREVRDTLFGWTRRGAAPPPPSPATARSAGGAGRRRVNADRSCAPPGARSARASSAWRVP